MIEILIENVYILFICEVIRDDLKSKYDSFEGIPKKNLNILVTHVVIL